MTPPARCPHALRREHCPTCSTRDVLVELQTTVDHLAANLLPGTARPWRAPQVSAEKRALLDAQAKEDRLHIAQQGHLPAHLRGQGVVVPPGESPAPYDLDIADQLATILSAADVLADLVAQDRNVHPPAPAASAFADPRPFLDFVTGWVEQLTPDVLEQVFTRAERLIADAAPALGLVTDGQLLEALCPWCRGATGAHPVGGARTLRVRTMTGVGPVVVCEGGRCEPEAESGTRYRGLPAWPQWEWDWLSDRIERTA